MQGPHSRLGAYPQVRASADAQGKLAAEKIALVGTVRGLNRQIAKLEGFKRNLLTSLQASEEVRGSHSQHD